MIHGNAMGSKVTAISAWLRSPTGIAVNALGITQIISWGTTFYSLAVLAAPITNDTGWSLTIIFGGMSIGLLISAVISTWAGYLLDTHGARFIMSIGSSSIHVANLTSNVKRQVFGTSPSHLEAI